MAQITDERLAKILSETQKAIMEHNARCESGSVKVNARLIESILMELQYRRKSSDLESHIVTVKLPDIMPPEAAPAHYWGSGESMAYADGYNKSAADLKTSFAQACSSAGVNVEFE